jgi:hypothetical protein
LVSRLLTHITLRRAWLAMVMKLGFMVMATGLAVTVGMAAGQELWPNAQSESSPYQGYHERPWARPDARNQPWPAYTGTDWAFREEGGFADHQPAGEALADPWPFFGVRPWGEYESPRYRREGPRERGRRPPERYPWRQPWGHDASAGFRPLGGARTAPLRSEQARGAGPLPAPSPW